MEINTQLTDDLEPVSHLAKRMLSEGAECVSSPGRIQIRRSATLGEEAFAVTLFEGIDYSTIHQYEKIHKVDIPATFARILNSLNGGNVFRLDLYGLPPSMTEDPPLLDRTEIQPLDLATANTLWCDDFAPRKGLFHIGSGPWSKNEDLGYFLLPDDSVVALKKGGEQISSWKSIKDLLSAEIARAEELYPEYEKSMARLFSQY